MQEFLSSLLHVNVTEREYSDLDKIPLFLLSSYQIKEVVIADTNILFIKPKTTVTFSALKKHWMKFEQLSGLPCVVFDDSYTRYGKKRMIELGIPFVFGSEDIYMPFLGIALTHKREVKLPEVEKFSPATQKLVLTALYKKWEQFSIKEIAQTLQVSRMTVGRCLLELQTLGLPLVKIHGNTKCYTFSGNREMLYEMCLPYFINPVVRTYALKSLPNDVHCLGGISAIAHYSMLADDRYPTYALSREEYRQLQGNTYEICPKTEVPVCKLQVMRYKIEQNHVIDPLSAILCMTEQDKNDPRIENAIDMILEELWNG